MNPQIKGQFLPSHKTRKSGCHCKRTIIAAITTIQDYSSVDIKSSTKNKKSVDIKKDLIFLHDEYENNKQKSRIDKRENKKRGRICNCLQRHALGTPSEETRTESVVEVESVVMAEEVMDVWMGIESICVVSARIHHPKLSTRSMGAKFEEIGSRPTVLFTATRSRFPIFASAFFSSTYLKRRSI